MIQTDCRGEARLRLRLRLLARRHGWNARSSRARRAGKSRGLASLMAGTRSLAGDLVHDLAEDRRVGGQLAAGVDVRVVVDLDDDDAAVLALLEVHAVEAVADGAARG